MVFNMKNKLINLALAVVLFLSSSSHAALIVVSDELVGATDIVISGLGTYDVSFQDGSCANIFSGCDSLSDFSFDSYEQVHAASQALLEQIFIDTTLGQFDSNPELIAGCEDFDKCIALIPYKLDIDWVFSKNIINSKNEADDRLYYTTNLGRDQSVVDRSNTTFAVFTKVIKVTSPATAWLFLTASIGLISLNRKN